MNSNSFRVILKKDPHTIDTQTMTNETSGKVTKRRHSSTLVGRSSSDILLLDSTKVNYKIYKIPDQLLRYIPQSQIDLIKPLIHNPSKSKFIQRKKYSTNVDDRSYLTVYEYQLGDNWIIWDYSTGYVFFTGLWKSCGNNKTDIVKLIDNFPNFISTESVRRVRGGFLKIQGTWLPYEIVKKLAKNFCYNLRYCLIPLFGEDFPNQCLKPDDKNFGKLVDIDAPISYRANISGDINENGHIRKPRSHSDSFQVKPSLRMSLTSQFNNIPIIEMEEMLKASKQLHELSFSGNSGDHRKSATIPRRYSFNYGGFLWSWHDDNNLTILGKDNENQFRDHDVFIDQVQSPLASPSSTNSKLNHSKSSNYSLPDLEQLSIISYSSNETSPRYFNGSYDPFRTSDPRPFQDQNLYNVNTDPKDFDGFETLLNAAVQLMNPNIDTEQGLHNGDYHQSFPFEKGYKNSNLLRKNNNVEDSPKKRMDIGGLLS